MFHPVTSDQYFPVFAFMIGQSHSEGEVISLVMKMARVGLKILWNRHLEMQYVSR
jgi:hypothetical protein